MGARIGGHGFAVTQEGETPSQFIGHELKIWRALEGQKGLQELLDLDRPCLVMVAAREVRDEALGLAKPCQAEAEEMGATDTEELGGLGRVDQAAVKGLDGLSDEIRSQALGELMLLFSTPSGPHATAGARHFVGLRYAQTSSMPRPGREVPSSLILSSLLSPFAPTPIGKSRALTAMAHAR